jgi:hypothetical protein
MTTLLQAYPLKKTKKHLSIFLRLQERNYVTIEKVQELIILQAKTG